MSDNDDSLHNKDQNSDGSIGKNDDTNTNDESTDTNGDSNSNDNESANDESNKYGNETPSQKVVRWFTNLAIAPIEDDIDHHYKYESARSATKFILTVASAAILLTWFLDYQIDYSLPNTAYGLSLSAYMSISFVITDIHRDVNQTGGVFNPSFTNDKIRNPVVYSAVARLAGLIFFSMGLFSQLFIQYFAAAPESTWEILSLLPPVIVQLPLHAIFDGLFWLCWGIAGLIAFGYEILIQFAKYVLGPILIVLLGAVILRCGGYDYYATLWVLGMVVIIQLLSIGKLLLMTARDFRGASRIATQHEEEVIND